MNHNMKKHLRGVLSLLLALCLVAGMCPAAFAAENETERDSITDYSKQEIATQLLQFLQEFWPKVDPSVQMSDPAKYVPTEDSYYVALGDSSVSGSSYVTMLANELQIESMNLGKADMMLADETYEVIEKNANDIRQADLVTLGYSAHVFLSNAIAEAVTKVSTGNSTMNMNWTDLVGAEYAAAVDMLLSDLRNELTTMGITGTKQDAVVCIVEACAYSATVYAVNLPEIIGTIRSYNETATIVVIGMYNPMENLDVYMDGSKLDLKDYMDKVLEAVDSHASDCCATTTNAAYVSVHSTETASEAKGDVHKVDAQNVMSLINLAKVIRNDMVPSDAGNTYIMNRFLQAMLPTYRVAGDNRYETAIKAADQLKASLDVKRFDTIIVANGTDFADALSASYLAAVEDAPILLSYSLGYKNNDKDIEDYVSENLSSDGIVYVVGGELAVTETLVNRLGRNTSASVQRLSGDNRLLTNLEVLKKAGVSNKDILVCYGWNYADSLAASATGLPILLVYGDKPTSDQAAFLKTLNGMNDFWIVGGEMAVSGDMQSAISGYGAVDRIPGDNRIETSVSIAEMFFDDVDKVIIANGWSFPDGLCGGPLGYSLGAPLLLTYERYEAPVAEYVLDNGIEEGIILGGVNAVSEAAANASLGK